LENQDWARQPLLSFVCSLVYQFPLGVIWASEVSGHPEQTEEKIIGRPDLGKLNQGKRMWSGPIFTQIPVKIVTRSTAFLKRSQSMILDGVDRGNWEYLNEMIIQRRVLPLCHCELSDGGRTRSSLPLWTGSMRWWSQGIPGPISPFSSVRGNEKIIFETFELEKTFIASLNRRLRMRRRCRGRAGL